MDWADSERGYGRLKPIPLREPHRIINFGGNAEEYAVSYYKVNRVEIAGRQVAWTFLAIFNAPAPVVLGLDFVRRHQLWYDPATDRIFFPYRFPPTHELVQPPSDTRPLLDTTPVSGDAPPSFLGHRKPSATSLPRRALLTGHTLSRAVVRQHDHLFVLHRHCIGRLRGGGSRSLQKRASTQTSSWWLTVSPRLFDPPDREPPERTVKHAIRLIPDAYPLKRKPFPLPPYKIKEMHTQVTELHQKGWIEPSHSPWGAPILFVPQEAQLTTAVRRLS